MSGSSLIFPKILKRIDHSKTVNSMKIAKRLKGINVWRAKNNVETIRLHYTKIAGQMEGIPNYRTHFGRSDTETTLIKDDGQNMKHSISTRRILDIFQRTKIWNYKNPIILGAGFGKIAFLGQSFKRDGIKSKMKFTCVESDYEMAMVSKLAKMALAKKIPSLRNVDILWGEPYCIDFSKYDYFFFNERYDKYSGALLKFSDMARPGSLFVMEDLRASVKYDGKKIGYRICGVPEKILAFDRKSWQE